MSTDPIKRAVVHFCGHVQGVGFRYTVLQIANEFEVTGTVQNLTDGRVRLVAEGEAGEIEEFVRAIHDRMIGYIRKLERTDESGPRQHRGFSIR